MNIYQIITDRIIAQLEQGIMNRLNLETSDTFTNTAAYIQSWLNVIKQDNRMVVSAASKAEKAVELILGETPTAAQDTENEAA